VIAGEIREIPGIKGYGASSDGRIWSCWKWGSTVLTDTWREITQKRKAESEYRRVHIGRFGFQKTCQVHRLVVSAFRGPIPKGMVVDHLDCDKSNNSLENLEVVTREENELRALNNGRKFRGEAHPNARYSEPQIRALKLDAALGGKTQGQLVLEHGIKRSTVQAVLSGRLWAHV
jgi:hypothetical protein